jgi:Spy/CpxP family protein refolding chaperone
MITEICGKTYRTAKEVKERYNQLKLDYADITDILTDMKVKGRGILGKNEFAKQRNATIKQRTQIEAEVRAYKKALKEYNLGEDISGIAIGVKNLIEKYDAFTQDRTRVSSMRIMASEITKELRVVLGKSNLIEIDY